MAMATTMPGRQPSARKLTASTMAMASISALDELADGLLDDVRLVCDEMHVDADGQGPRSASASRSFMCSPNASTLPFLAIEMARPIAGSPLKRNIGCGGSA